MDAKYLSGRVSHGIGLRKGRANPPRHPRYSARIIASFFAAPFSTPGQNHRSVCTVKAASSDALSTAQTAALVSGAIFNPVVLYSEWTLFSTGKGLDPGPAGIYGALEGIGFLVVPGIVIYSLITKARTGGGLPAGPSGALGGVEGLSWLTTILGIAVFANEFLSKGSLPGVTG